MNSSGDLISLVATKSWRPSSVFVEIRKALVCAEWADPSLVVQVVDTVLSGARRAFQKDLARGAQMSPPHVYAMRQILNERRFPAALVYRLADRLRRFAQSSPAR